MTNDKQLDYLIGTLYQAAMVPGLWREALRLCGQYVDAVNGVLLTVDKQNDISLASVLQATGFSSQSGNKGTDHAINTDYLLNLLGGAVVNDWRCGHHDFVDRSQSDQDSSDNYMMAAWVDDNEDQRSLLALFRPVNQQPFNGDDQLLARHFGGHFQRALRMQRQAQALHSQSEMCIMAMDALSLPMLIVNDKGTVLHVNTCAERLLNRQADGLSINADGMLCCTHSVINTQLTALITHATDNKPLGGAMFLNDNRIEQLFAKPLTTTSVFNQGCVPLALIMVAETGDNVARLQLLGKLYCLTPAELRMASALLQGKSPDDYAKEERIMIGTARSHLKALFRKTGTCRQAELVALLSKVPML